MRERLEMVGGRFDILSAPGKGTAITARMPLGKLAKNADGEEIVDGVR
jgi:signal transduction histidine kinase